MDQRNISAKNIARLTCLCEFAVAYVRQRAELVLEVARVKPGKRRRRGWLAKHKPDLLVQLVRQGLLEDVWEDWDSVSEALTPNMTAL